MNKLWADMTPVEKMRRRGKSIIRMRDGRTKRLLVRTPNTDPHILTGGQVVAVRRLDPPEQTSRGLPIEWEEA